jgi:hypothetical protein
MPDPMFSQWPQIPGRKIVKAEAQLVDKVQSLFRVEFTDSAGKKLSVQMPDAALNSLVDTGKALLNR